MSSVSLRLTSFRAILVVLMVLSALLASGRATAATPVTLTYWDFTASTMPIEKTLIQNFQRQNPDIRINLVNMPLSNYENKLILDARTHSLPDVFQAIPEWLFDLVQASAARDVSPYISAQGPRYRSTFTRSGWSEVTHNGKVYGLPFRWGNSAVFINPALFRKYHVAIPKHWTMAQFERDAKQLTHPANGDYGFANGVSSAQSDLASSWDWLGFYFAFGGKYIANNRVNFASAQGVRALTWYVNLFNKDKVGPPGMTSWITSNVLTSFGTGHLAMWINGPWYIASIKTSYAKLKFTTVPLPTAFRYGSAAGGTIISASSQTHHPAQAFKFIKYLTSPAVLRKWAKAGDFIPPSAPVLRSGIYKQPPLKAYTQYANKPGTIVIGLTPKNTTLMLSLQNGIESALLGHTTPRQALQQVTKRWNQVLNAKS